MSVGKKTGVYGNIQTSAANSDTWQITKAAILTGYPVLRRAICDPIMNFTAL